MADIFVFGDSIGYGAWDEKGGWADRLKQYFHTQKLKHPEASGTEVYNLSVDGDTSSDVAKRMRTDLLARQRPWSSEADLVIVAIGTNDTYAKNTPDNFRFSVSDYVQNLETIYEVVNQAKKKLAFISLDPVDETKTNPTDDGTHFWTNGRIKEFNEALKSFCDKRAIPFLDIFEAYQALPDFRERFFDGLHPNTSGHEWMYEKILPFIKEQLK